MKKLTKNRTLSGVVLAAFAVTSVMAESSSELIVLEGYPSSSAVLDGNYPEAISLALAQLNANEKPSRKERFASQTALCVAYAKTRQMEHALVSCTAAKRLAKRAANADEIFTPGTGLGRRTLEQVARANFALVSALAAANAATSPIESE